MKYKLHDTAITESPDVLKYLLKKRGVKDVDTYIDINSAPDYLEDKVVTSYSELCNMNLATQLLATHIYNGSKISILVDEDVDGFCSAAMMYSYLKSVAPQCQINYILHQKSKAHGLTEDVIIPENTELLIVPDAGTNDVDQCARLNQSGIDIIILDHHEVDEKINVNSVSKHIGSTIIVNNQMSNSYPNKDLCGAGIVYRFLQSLDNELWEAEADNYLDLCALANISDVMDVRSPETKYLIAKGLKNVKNKCLKEFINKQSFRMGNQVNIHNIQWYITPVLNGMIRMGTSDEKELLFRAFVETDEIFEYKTRATKTTPSKVVDETIYARAVRLSSNAKTRQDKERNKSLEIICQNLEETDDKIILINGTDIVHSSLTGIVAIQISERYKKPCIIYRPVKDSGNDCIIYGGSGRNFSNSPVTDFKNVLQATNLFEFARGHSNAFGFKISKDNLFELTASVNEQLKDIQYDKTYIVDFILTPDDVDVRLVSDCSQLDDYLGQGIDECLIAVENFELNRYQCYIIGKNEDSIKFYLNDVEYIQFKCKEGNPLYDFLNDTWSDEDTITVNLVGTPSINKYEGIAKPQIVIKDIEKIETKCANNKNSEFQKIGR